MNSVDELFKATVLMCRAASKTGAGFWGSQWWRLHCHMLMNNNLMKIGGEEAVVFETYCDRAFCPLTVGGRKEMKRK